MQEYTDGHLTDALAQIRERGFDIGCHVVMNSLEWSVVDATSDAMSLKNDQNAELQEMSASSLLAQCTLSSPKSEEVLHYRLWFRPDELV